MTFKLPDPTLWISGDGYWIRSQDKDSRPDKNRFKEPAYSKDQLIQALRDWSEEMAQVCGAMSPAEYATGKVDHNEMAWTDSCAHAIREKVKEL